MKQRGFVVLLFAVCLYQVKGFPHQSTEESDDSTETTEAEVGVVVPAITHRAESTELSHESHEEDDRGSVSDSDEAKTPEAEAKTPEAEAKTPEDEPMSADEPPHDDSDDHSKAPEDAAKMAEDLAKSIGDETRSPAFRPKVVDVERMIEAELKEAEEEAIQSMKGEEKLKEEEVKGDEEGKGTEEDESDEDSAGVKFPKTESLCPARPEEITKIESECADEYRQWKAMRAKKFAQQTAVEKTTEATKVTTTTIQTTSESEATTTTIQPPTTEAMTEPVKLLDIVVGDNDMETTTNEVADQLLESTLPTSDLPLISHDDLQSVTTDDAFPMEGDDDLPRTEVPVLETSTMPTTTTVTTETDTWAMGRKKRSSRKVIKKRSCYPATCILRKLNLLDSMGQPSIERIQSFAINMTVDEKTNLEEKAVGCVKEINEAMIDASADIGKKVGCVAQKVISCLNKGLMCPIMKVPQ